jgi:hypothetical protein
MNDMSGKASDFVRDLGDAARRNPVSAALIGMGVLWMFTGNRPLERAGNLARSTGLDRIPEAAGNALDAARSGLQSGTDAVSGGVASATGALRHGGADVLDHATRLGRDYADTATGYVRSLPGSGAEMFDTARANLTDIFRTQPLALGAIGLAIGAGIAAAIPPSDLEGDYLGETSERVKARASEFAAETTDRLTRVAGDVAEAVTEEARRQGLTADGVKSAAGDISAKVGRVLDVAGKGISERASLVR